MNADEYQRQALRTAPAMFQGLKMANAALGLTGESGEVSDYIKKVLFHGHDLDKTKVMDELGDVLWYVALMADAIEVPLSTIMAANIEKLKARYPDGFDPERSKKRQ